MRDDAATLDPKNGPLRTCMADADFYAQLDPGIRFAVRVLHSRGIPTCQSCQGGPDPKRPDRGHAYDRPTIDLAGSNGADGFGALAALHSFGLPVRDISILWEVHQGLPLERLWRITFWKSMEDRAEDSLMFVYGYQAQADTPIAPRKKGGRPKGSKTRGGGKPVSPTTTTPRGRKVSGLRVDQMAEAKKQIQAGATIAAAAKSIAVSYGTVYAWAKTNGWEATA